MSHNPPSCSALDHLLSTNDPPSGLDAAHIEAWEDSFDAELAIIDGDIERHLATNHHRTVVPALRDRRTRLNEEKHKYRPCLSAFRQFPLEILQEIFGWVHASPLIDVFNPNEHIWVIGLVCCAWRNALHSSPRLWARTLLVNVRTARLRRDATAALKLVLSRTGSVDLSFQLLEGDQVHGNGFALEFLSLLVECRERWSFVSFQCMTQNTFLELCRQTTTGIRLPRLREAHLDLGRSFLDPHPPLHAFEFAPLLTTLSLHRVGFSDVILNSKQLTSVKFHRSYAAVDSAQHALDILEACPHLEHFETDPGQTHFLPHANALSSIAHSSLKRLVTCDINLIRCLTLPSLESLTIPSSNTERFYTHVDAIQPLYKFLERSKCPLKVLRLDNFTLSLMADLLLWVVPELEELAFVYTISPNSSTRNELRRIFKTMREGYNVREKGCFLPRLRRLAFYDYNRSQPSQLTFIDDAFVDMLRVRHYETGLEAVDFKIFCEREREALPLDIENWPYKDLGNQSLEDLRALRKAGMEVDIVEMCDEVNLVD